MIITGAENVYSVEVENALSSHLYVVEGAVIGIRHEKWGAKRRSAAAIGFTASEGQFHIAWSREPILPSSRS